MGNEDDDPVTPSLLSVAKDSNGKMSSSPGDTEIVGTRNVHCADSLVD